MSDLSAAIDTVDHGILLHRLCNRFGINGKVLLTERNWLKWMAHHLSILHLTAVYHGVPFLYSLYTSPLAPIRDIAREYDMNNHFYADDTQLYIPFCWRSVEINKGKLEACVSDINNWMLTNKLNLDKDNTELLYLWFHLLFDLDLQLKSYLLYVWLNSMLLHRCT